MQSIIAREIFILIFFPSFSPPGKWLKEPDLVVSHPKTFQNIFASGSSGSFKARMLTILLRTLNYDDLNIKKKKKDDDDERSHLEATLLTSFCFLFF